jgi:NADPH:quinone reductase-like Zn-dependent oxidoreductase
VKAIAYSSYGGAEVLSLTDVDEPKIGPDWVTVAVKASVRVRRRTRRPRALGRP